MIIAYTVYRIVPPTYAAFLNIGISLSTGDFIDRIDADDIMLPNRYFSVSKSYHGVVTLMSIWSSNQNVSVGETVFTVISSQQNKPKGKAMLPVQGAGKVKKVGV